MKRSTNAMNLREFFAAFLTAVSTYYPEEVDRNSRPIDLPQENVRSTYDFVIVGGGSAGSVLASRLTEIDSWSVLLIEAGGPENAISDTPAFFPVLWRSERDWNFMTVPQRYNCKQTQGRCEFPRGRVLGGSSVINAMLYARGNRDDYDEWAQMGNTDWSYEDLLPYFIRSENASDYQPVPSQTATDDARLRGYDGPLAVSLSPSEPELVQTTLRAFTEWGFDMGDTNGVNQTRADNFPKTIRGGSRGSAARSYLNPARNRPNLNVILHSYVTRVLIDDNGAASGVEYTRNGQNFTVSASKEVIISAGAINTPQILMLSGIGPAEDLSALGIKVLKNLPVGQNLQDHILSGIPFDLNLPSQLTVRQFLSEESITEYARNHRGPLTFPYVMSVAYKSYNGAPWPNAQLMTALLPSQNDSHTTLSLMPAFVKPKSVGSVRLQSSNPYDPPLLDPNYLGTEEDLNAYTAIINDFIQILNTPSLAQYSPRLNPIILNTCNITDASQIASCVIENFSGTYFHPVGTARMGPDSDTNSVVDNLLAVKGLSRLRVIDASVMPTLINANTNAPTCAIAEKASDLIKAIYGVLRPN